MSPAIRSSVDTKLENHAVRISAVEKAQEKLGEKIDKIFWLALTTLVGVVVHLAFYARTGH
jgi:hypothetical protein